MILTPHPIHVTSWTLAQVQPGGTSSSSCHRHNQRITTFCNISGNEVTVNPSIIFYTSSALRILNFVSASFILSVILYFHVRQWYLLYKHPHLNYFLAIANNLKVTYLQLHNRILYLNNVTKLYLLSIQKQDIICLSLSSFTEDEKF